MSSGKDVRSQPPEDRLKFITNPNIRDVYRPEIPIKRYFRSCKELLSQADDYFKNNELETCLQYYMKFIILFLENMPNHPDYKSYSLEKPAEVKEMKSACKIVMDKSEAIKIILLEKFKKDHEEYLIEKDKRDKELHLQHLKQVQQKELEIERKKSTPNESGPSLMYDRIEALEQTYNKIRHVQPLPENIYPNFDIIMSTSSKIDKPKADTPNSYYGTPPPPYSSINPTPSFDRTKKPTTVQQHTEEYTPSNYLRPVVVPSQLLSSFLILAQRNTDKNVETCGILAGRVSQNELRVTHLLVPKQAGTADSCITHHEEEIFSYQDQYNLITLGWIHTHPSQTAFLSSVDLHTHCSYQLMMPEAIAIVCAPKHNEQGIFCLTPYYGLDVIASCKQTSGFHPHPNNIPLFMIAEHSRLDYQSQVEVIDLRNR